MSKEKTIYIIDGHSFLYKSYFAIKGMMTRDGTPTNAVYGFLLTLKKILREYEPQRLIVAFDYPAHTFRKKLYEEYKANRPKMPEDLSVQIPLIKEVLKALNIPFIEQEGYEADDLIGTISKMATECGFDSFIASIDKDLFQLVNQRTKILYMKKDQVEILDRERVKEVIKVYPEHVTDYLGLIGDTSDNIPGVPSIGPVSAEKLIDEFGSMENIYNKISEIKKDKLRDLLNQYKDQALLSKELATICTSVPIELELESMVVGKPNEEELINLFKKLEFKSLMDSFEVKHPQRETNYKTVSKESELQEYLSAIKEGDVLAVDTETTSTNSMEAELVGISLSYKENTAIYIPIGHKSDLLPMDNQASIRTVRTLLNPILTNPKIKKAAHNVKYDRVVLERHGFEFDKFYMDTMVAQYVLDPSRISYGLKKLALEILNIKMTPIEELIGSGKNQISMANLDIKIVSDYSCQDADVTYQLTRKYEKDLKENNLEQLLYEIEMPLVDVLEQMEENGIAIDKEHFKKLSIKMGNRLEELSNQIYKIVGHNFNINSPSQLSEILFGELKLKPLKKTKSGFSTDITVLKELTSQHELPIILVEYRSLEKLKSTYVDTLPKLVNPTTGKIHTSFNQTVTATGRLSSSDPNLQNIPNRSSDGLEIRKGFIPSKAGYRFISADYSQIELRLLAHVSGDDTLIKAFNSDEDIHKLTASKIFNIPEDKVESYMRNYAKTINFGIIYGMSAHKLSNELKITRAKASSFIEEYFNIYSKVKQCIEQTLQECIDSGYVATLLGRKRYIPEINSSNFNERSNAERMAFNTKLQGTAADLIKIAMINIHKELIERKLETKMLLQVHDELIFEGPDNEIEEVKVFIKDKMENAIKLNVPLKVDVRTADNWADAK